MTAGAPRFVPKVHPASRSAEPEDPLLMQAISVEGDPDLMLRCVVQEFLSMGWDVEQILSLFEDPEYPALCELGQYYGVTGLRERIAGLLGPVHRLPFEVVMWEAPESKPEPELLELGVLAPRQGGDDHA
jgi:hypothetical protein